MTRWLAVFVLMAAAVLVVIQGGRGPAQTGPSKDSFQERVRKLEAEVKRLEQLVPDQAAVMCRLSYHWTNLWFALVEKNWELADFYLGETRNNLHWAVRVRPVRQSKAGEKVDLKAIAEALDNTQFKQMKEAITDHDRGRCVKLYDEAMTGCYACHKASEKPYLRPQRPRAPETGIINFDPRAKDPQ